MGREIASARPEGTIRLDQFIPANVQIWVDGRPIELNRVEIYFESDEAKVRAVEKLAHLSLESREKAIEFLLNVLDHFSKAVPAKVIE